MAEDSARHQRGCRRPQQAGRQRRATTSRRRRRRRRRRPRAAGETMTMSSSVSATRPGRAALSLWICLEQQPWQARQAVLAQGGRAAAAGRRGSGRCWRARLARHAGLLLHARRPRGRGGRGARVSPRGGQGRLDVQLAAQLGPRAGPGGTLGLRLGRHALVVVERRACKQGDKERVTRENARKTRFHPLETPILVQANWAKKDFYARVYSMYGFHEFIPSSLFKFA